MGVFSLIQLNHFTKDYKVEAQRWALPLCWCVRRSCAYIILCDVSVVSALEESNHPTRWYPFAVTGINVTAFMIELIDERLLDIKLYRHGAGGENNSVNVGLKELHDVYGAFELLDRTNPFSNFSNFLNLQCAQPQFSRASTSCG